MSSIVSDFMCILSPVRRDCTRQPRRRSNLDELLRKISLWRYCQTCFTCECDSAKHFTRAHEKAYDHLRQTERRVMYHNNSSYKFDNMMTSSILFTHGWSGDSISNSEETRCNNLAAFQLSIILYGYIKLTLFFRFLNFSHCKSWIKMKFSSDERWLKFQCIA